MNNENNFIEYSDDKQRITLVTGRIRRTIDLYAILYIEVEKRDSFYKVTFKLGEDDYLHIFLDNKKEVDKLVNTIKSIDSKYPKTHKLLGVDYENSY